jgi:predicted transcriptional regulator YdeE
MPPEIIERPMMMLAGVVNCGKDAGSIDIHGLWNAYSKSESGIANRIDGAWYELHVGEKAGNGIYSVLAGAEVKEVGELPFEVSLKIIPAGRYAHFAHCMKDGGYGEAFAAVETWIKETGTAVKDFGLQLYDRDFDSSNKNSILHIYIPLDK